MQLIDRLKAVHESGYVYLDLKPDNILIGDSKNGELHKVRLIDFGICQKYLDRNKKHKQLVRVNDFRGNFAFASVYAFHFVTQSRRDDLISLCYLLVFLVNGELPLFEYERNM